MTTYGQIKLRTYIIPYRYFHPCLVHLYHIYRATAFKEYHIIKLLKRPGKTGVHDQPLFDSVPVFNMLPFGQSFHLRLNEIPSMRYDTSLEKNLE